MGSLVITEKPDMAKNVINAIGNKFGPVLPSQGHIFKLEEPEDANPDWKGSWKPGLLHPGRFYKSVLASETSAQAKFRAIQQAAKNVDTIILAGDPDREGQLICHEIITGLGFKGKVMRVMLNKTDPVGIRKLFDEMKPNSEFDGLTNAGIARQQADQICNLSLTRTVSSTIQHSSLGGAIGVGRVMTAVEAILCQRELEIRNFVPKNLFNIVAHVQSGDKSVDLTCSRLPDGVKQNVDGQDGEIEDDAETALTIAGVDENSGRIQDKSLAQALADAAKGFSGPIKVEQAMKSSGPPKLFNLAGLGKAMSGKAGWSSERTLAIAQSLYEKGLITYPRGDWTYLPSSAISEAKPLLAALFNLPPYQSLERVVGEPKIRTGKAGIFYDGSASQPAPAHFAIIPNVTYASEFSAKLAGISGDEAMMFDVVARSFIASVAPDYQYHQTVMLMIVPFSGAGFEFKTTGNVPKVMGWRQVLSSFKAKKQDDEADDLPAIANGSHGQIKDTSLKTSETKPPNRYADGEMPVIMEQAWRFASDPVQRAKLKEIEGIGRPSSRSNMLKKLRETGCVDVKGKYLIPTEGCMQLYLFFRKYAPELTDVVRTAVWESLFAMVEQGKMSAREAVDRLAEDTNKSLQKIVAASKLLSADERIRLGDPRKGGGGGGATPKMLAAAQAVAKFKNVALPPDITQFETCKAFLDTNMEKREEGAAPTNWKPSDAQVNFAKTLAERLGRTLPPDFVNDGRALRDWINKHNPDSASQGSSGTQGSSGAGSGAPRIGNGPSEKQISYAEKIAKDKGKKIPAAARADGKLLSKWIDENK